jgi:flagellar hook-length control protein FliK
MDMRQLIAQIDHIENKQILNEDAHYATAPVDNSPRVSKSNNQTSIYEMLIKEFGYDLNEIGPIQGAPGTAPAAAAPAAGGVANPYQGADAAKFAAMSPADQAWLTKGGGKPDINDEFILRRAPNGGKPAAPAAGALPAGALPAGMTQADYNRAIDREEPEAAPAAPAAAAPNSGSSYTGGVGNATNGSAAQPAASALPAGMTQADVDAAQNRSEPDPRLPAGMTQADVDAAQNRSEPASAAQPAKPAAGASNKSMTPAITAYASRMGLLKNNKPDVAAIKKFQQDNGLKADGIIGPNTAGAILSAQKPGAGGRGGPTAAQAAQATPAAKPAGGAAQPAPKSSVPGAGQKGPTVAAAQGKDPSNPLNKAPAGGAAQPAAKAATKPAGGATMPAVDQMGNATGVPAAGAGSPSEQKLEKKLAASGAPVQQGAVSTAYENSVKSQDDAILERIRKALFR